MLKTDYPVAIPDVHDELQEAALQLHHVSDILETYLNNIRPMETTLWQEETQDFTRLVRELDHLLGPINSLHTIWNDMEDSLRVFRDHFTTYMEITDAADKQQQIEVWRVFGHLETLLMVILKGEWRKNVESVCAMCLRIDEQAQKLDQLLSTLSLERRPVKNDTDATRTGSLEADQSINLEKEPFIGMWTDRDDMQESSEWVRKIRGCEQVPVHDRDS